MAGEGAAAGPKQDDTQPHPVKDQLPDISYCITSPPPWRMFFSNNTFMLLLLGLFFLTSLQFGGSRSLFCNCFSLLMVKSSRAAEAVLLGFQHYLVMLGTTVIIPTALVPQMGGGNVRLGQLQNLCFRHA